MRAYAGGYNYSIEGAVIDTILSNGPNTPTQIQVENMREMMAKLIEHLVENTNNHFSPDDVQRLLDPKFTVKW